ncbi:oxysterol-binding protein 1-like isoform X6 [Dunckerocampus dactyliophorus]|uniref:oxysterol-binding protein 1-like isoform X6 n=1 Tax=Dunckerocampus dactyliophorus TaxID=161453 RepID=UPI0024069193|nr:oxysterol-binding protein 1-like isoform X6 [Dunckerocampus dactyliophorus]
MSSEPKPSKPPTPTPGDTYKGWLFKWTNYIKGYQRRWFVLSNGLLSYYRTQAEMGHTCRGTINLATANIVVEDSCNFVISNGGAQTYHLKANSEVERQRWITALELAFHTGNESDDSCEDSPSAPPTSGHGSGRTLEIQSTLRTLSSKVEDLNTCNDLIVKHGSALQRRSGSNISGFSNETGMDDQSVNFDELSMASSPESPQSMEPVRQRRTRIPDKPNYYLNLWSIMKNCIGKELSKIPMPVNFNEPLSMLQRLSEDLEYYELLDKAAKCQSALEQMCYVAAFTVSSYSTTVHRTGKPFNPLLGETFELDRLRECGYRSLCEQVSHHPPAAAHHAFSEKGWTLRQEITLASKFRGKYLSVMPLGSIHCMFAKSNNHYSWKKVTTTIHNIIVGKLWIDQSGEIDVVNHKTGDHCHLKFAPYSYFSRDVPRKVTGVVTDKDGKAHYVLSGTWDEKMEFSRIMQSSKSENGAEGKQRTVYQTLKAKEIWRKNPLPEGAETMYFFSSLALTLNEPEEGVAPTDSRRRPDQRLMEDGHWDEANAEKQRLEEKQRTARREREREVVKAAHAPEDASTQEPTSDSPLKTDADEAETEDSEVSDETSHGEAPASCQMEGSEASCGVPPKTPHPDSYQALWFEKIDDAKSGDTLHVYKGGYWETKDTGVWDMCPDIF